METLKKNREFKTVYEKRKSIADSNLALYYTLSQNNITRFGISVSSKVGNSVVRNRLKRQIKEILRLNHDTISEGYDIIFVVRIRCRNIGFEKIKESVYHLLRKANLLKNPAEFI